MTRPVQLRSASNMPNLRQHLFAKPMSEELHQGSWTFLFGRMAAGTLIQFKRSLSMPSQMLTIARSDDSYVAALDAKGFSTNSTIEHDGKVYTHDDIAAMTEAAYRKHRPEYAIICG